MRLYTLGRAAQQRAPLHGHDRNRAPFRVCHRRCSKNQKGVPESPFLDPTTALAANKVVSKVATRVVRPHGFAAVHPGEESSFMAPQEVTLLPGVGPKLSLRMGALGITFMEELARLSEPQAVVAFGPHAPKLQRHARGVDPEPVLQSQRTHASISFSRVFATDSNSPEIIAAHLALLTEQIGYTLRTQNRSAGKLRLVVHFSDQKSTTRQAKLSPPQHEDAPLYAAAKSLLSKALQRRVRVRRLTLTLLNLSRESQQLDLFAPPPAQAIQNALDTLRGRYGKRTIQRGSTLELP